MEGIPETFINIAIARLEDIKTFYENEVEGLVAEQDSFFVPFELLECAELIFKCYNLMMKEGDDDQDEDDELFRALNDLVMALTADCENRVALTKGNGKAKVYIEEEQLRYLVESGFKAKTISEMFDCSKRTIERKMKKYNLSLRNYTIVCDDDLDNIIGEITSMFPSTGEKIISGRLRSHGIVVQRERIRQSLRRVDPMGVEARCRRVLHRRRYHVPSSNALWHIDGYHKLIRWKYVIFGGIDGYSRLIMYLKLSSNNSADSALNAFLTGVDEYGIPSRVRLDKGGENIRIADYMVETKGPNRGSAIVGRSVHNQRIERLWRDLFTGCVSFFYYFFYYLERIGLLNIDNDADMYALHFVFTPLIQRHLDMFRSAWGSHKLRTENNCSPNQLWIQGMQHVVNDEDDELDVEVYGIDFDEPVPLETDAVTLNDMDDLLDERHKDNLLRTLNSVSIGDYSQEGMLIKFSLAKAFINNSFIQ
jgi:hypothetical protein